MTAKKMVGFTSPLQDAEESDSSLIVSHYLKTVRYRSEGKNSLDDKKEEEKEVKKCFLDVSGAKAALHSPFHLVYEDLAGEPWKVVVASYLVERINAMRGNCFIIDFFKYFPTLASINVVELRKHFTVIILSWFL